MNDEKIFEEDEKVEVIKRYDIPYVNLRLDVPIGATVHSIYIQYGFIKNNYVNSLHTHTHSEVHVFLGPATFYCDDNVYELEGGTIILVPRGVYHNFDMADATLHSAFQINMEAPFHLHKVSKELLCEYFQKLDGCVDLSEFSRIVPYISFFCSYLFPQSEKVEPKKINDYGFLINEFFSLRYTSQIDISDLVKTLCVSEKQTCYQAHGKHLRCRAYQAANVGGRKAYQGRKTTSFKSRACRRISDLCGILESI